MTSATQTRPKPTQPHGRHRLVEDQHAERELDGRREVLKEADRGHRDPGRGRSEADQGYGGHDARRGDQQRMSDALGAEGRGPLVGQPQDVTRGDRCEHEGLHREALDRTHVGLLLGQPVAAEGEGEDQGDPRRPAVLDGQADHGEGRDAQSDPLESAQPLAEDRDSHQHGDQGVDEVAERGLDDVAVVDSPDVGAPVHRDHDGREREDGHRAAFAEHRPEPAAAAYRRPPGPASRPGTRTRGGPGSRPPPPARAAASTAGTGPTSRRRPRRGRSRVVSLPPRDPNRHVRAKPMGRH